MLWCGSLDVIIIKDPDPGSALSFIGIRIQKAWHNLDPYNHDPDKEVNIESFLKDVKQIDDFIIDLNQKNEDFLT